MTEITSVPDNCNMPLSVVEGQKMIVDLRTSSPLRCSVLKMYCPLKNDPKMVKIKFEIDLLILK